MIHRLCLLPLLIASCVFTSCGQDTVNNFAKEELSEEEKSQRCDAARTDAADAYAMLDRSCTQDSDCTIEPIGGCNCPVPLSTSADTEEFRGRVERAKQACGEYYAGPGAQTCTNAVICDFATLSSDDTAVCNEQGMCDEPPAIDEESM